MRAAAVWLLLCGCTHSDPLEEWVSEPAPRLDGESVTGAHFALGDVRGHLAVVAFGYASCTAVCPLTLEKLRAIHRELADVREVYVTVDPDRDDAQTLARFVGPGVDAVRVATDQLDAWAPTRRHLPLPDGGYLMDHAAGLWVIDSKGSVRIRYAQDAPAALVVKGLQRLMTE